ncbi:MAG: substrate-binding domain-containing protein [Candidatus Methylumidiphilus sp.]
MATFYKCPNLGNCDKADKGETLSIPTGAPAECPECRAQLMPTQGTKTQVNDAVIWGGIILILLLIAGAAWFFLKDDNPTPPATSTPVSATGQTSPTASTPIPAPVVPPTSAALLRFHGSDTIGGKLLPALATAFLQQEGYTNIHQENGAKDDESNIVGERNGKKEQIEIQAHGSSTAFNDLKDGLCDIGMSSRKIKPEEQQRLLPTLGDLTSNASEHVIALDGIAIIVHPTNPIKALSVAQAADIFGGAIVDWSKVGGRAGPIALYARDDQSGTYDFFKEAVLIAHGKSLAANAQRFEDGNKLSAAVTAAPNGIGFVGLNYIGSNKVLALSDAGVEARKPTLLTIKTEDYRLSRRLYLYTAERPSNPNVAKFIEFAVGSDGQRIVQSTGLVNLDPTPIASVDSGDARGQSVRWKGLTKGATEMATHIHFRSGSNDLDVRANRDIGRIGGVVSLPPYQNKKVTLIGFADNSGVRALNCKLSQERADRVRQELAVEGLAFDQVVGLCDEAPIAPNDTPANREINRRVEVWVK